MQDKLEQITEQIGTPISITPDSTHPQKSSAWKAPNEESWQPVRADARFESLKEKVESRGKGKIPEAEELWRLGPCIPQGDLGGRLGQGHADWTGVRRISTLVHTLQRLNATELRAEVCRITGGSANVAGSE
jgi:hypothetical protein